MATTANPIRAGGITLLLLLVLAPAACADDGEGEPPAEVVELAGEGAPRAEGTRPQTAPPSAGDTLHLRMEQVQRSLRAYGAMMEMLLADTTRYAPISEAFDSVAEGGAESMGRFTEAVARFPELEQAIEAEGVEPGEMLLTTTVVLNAFFASTELGEADVAALRLDQRQHMAFVREHRAELERLISAIPDPEGM